MILLNSWYNGREHKDLVFFKRRYGDKMKKSIIFLITSMFVLFSLQDSLYSGSPVTWYTYNEGIALAKKTKKPVVIDFYADWCKWCKVMDKQTFGDPAVSKIMKKHYINIRIDTMSKGEVIRFKNHRFSGQDFARVMGVTGLPTVVFLDDQENIITRIPGFVQKDVFLPLLGYIKDRCYLKNVSFQDYVQDKGTCGK